MTETADRRNSSDEVVGTDSFKLEVHQWATVVGVEIGEIHVRKMTRKWASSSTRGRLTFDVELLEEAQPRREEVIVHELVHLKVGSHGPLFRHLVRAFLKEGLH